ncbi:hypothetical protein [Aquitalea sp.]|uniref:hypothetical protein n=1 Tax=Aquitalea sp. TaxID=1872623 RepID=UPI002587FBCC|nr:hypothetical protein [Aquitalea sp.]
MKKVLCSIALTLSACSGHANEVWTVQKSMPVFKEPNDDLKAPIFVLQSGEKCIPLDHAVAKVYAYTQVRCGEREGWVADDDFLKQSPH